jgi:Zn-dependent protease
MSGNSAWGLRWPGRRPTPDSPDPETVGPPAFPPSSADARLAAAGSDAPAWTAGTSIDSEGRGIGDDREPIQPGSGRRGALKRIAAPLVAVLVFLATKAKTLLLVLPKLKFLTTSGSMLVSVAAYQLIFGWAFAVGFVLLLLLHEMGHVVQLRREGIQASAPMFIPFLGAVISAKSLGNDAAAEARVGLAGPILGSIATLVPLGIWLATGDEFWRALAYIGFLLNLFNLLPILPLDGGRAMAALSPWVWFAGFAGLIALFFIIPNPILLLILVIGGLESWRRWKGRNTPEAQAFHAVPKRTRVLVAVTYLALAGLLAFGVSETFFERSLSDV